MQSRESRLQLARRHVVEAELRIIEQELRIPRLMAKGHDTTVAVFLLQTYKQILDQMLEHLAFEESN
jgi:hypothetical protein